jgi:hypothetical protein
MITSAAINAVSRPIPVGTAQPALCVFAKKSFR